MKNTSLAVSLLAIALALAGCSKEAPKSEKSAGGGAASGASEVKIGHVGPLTGGIAHLGKDNGNRARPAIASYLATEKKPKLVAVIDDATAYGEGIANEVEKTLKSANIKVLPREKGTDKTTDWKAVLTKLRGRNPDAAFYGGMDATGGPLMKQGRELGMKAGVSFGGGACTDKMKELAGDAGQGLLCSPAGHPPPAAHQ